MSPDPHDAAVLAHESPREVNWGHYLRLPSGGLQYKVVYFSSPPALRASTARQPSRNYNSHLPLLPDLLHYVQKLNRAAA